ncbi:ATP-dependent_DNA helicase [Hexamita inflata]|uniref:ATP-dependent DNA helicase n=1 Tax=Hexamita inflata TaxID=28002 RepID=A0AA86QJJ4_9EUKA|nr:ATP-dependent DNA helicase [Hexamita inflata]
MSTWSASAIKTEKQAEHYKSLSFEQKLVFNEIVFKGRNTFFTGMAGSGKSYLTRSIIKSISAMHGEFVAITSMTGIAALNINGQTLHSALSARISDQIFDTIDENERTIFRNSHQNAAIRTKLKQLQVLIIDEVSMLPGYLFDAMQLLFRRIKGKSEFFGGLQVILCGDFMQLPPISRTNKQLYLFDSEAFKNIDLKVQLCKSFRQLHDQSFLSVLNQIRDGIVSGGVVKTLQQKITTETSINLKQKIEVQNCLQTFKDLKSKNEAKIKQLYLKLQHFHTSSSQHDLQSALLEQKKQLRILRHFKELQFETHNLQYVPPTFPIRLYAVNHYVLKHNIESLAQRQTQIFQIQSDDTGSLEHLKQMEKPEPQILVCEGAQIMINRNVDMNNGLCNGTVGVVRRIFYQTKEPLIKMRQDGVEYTILNAVQNVVQLEVVIQTPLGERRHMLGVHKCEQSNQVGRIVATRQQVPIQLAYAISIHKSQGITLKEAIIQLDKCFAHGQAYVALSRLQSLEGLQLTSFDPKYIKCDEVCVQFHKNVSKLDMEDKKCNFKENGMFTVGNNLIQPRLLVETSVWIQWAEQTESVQYQPNIQITSINSSVKMQSKSFIMSSSSEGEQQETERQQIQRDPIANTNDVGLLHVIEQIQPQTNTQAHKPAIKIIKNSQPQNTQITTNQPQIQQQQPNQQNQQQQLTQQNQPQLPRIQIRSQEQKRIQGRTSPLRIVDTHDVVDISDSETASISDSAPDISQHLLELKSNSVHTSQNLHSSSKPQTNIQPQNNNVQNDNTINTTTIKQSPFEVIPMKEPEKIIMAPEKRLIIKKKTKTDQITAENNKTTGIQEENGGKTLSKSFLPKKTVIEDKGIYDYEYFLPFLLRLIPDVD